MIINNPNEIIQNVMSRAEKAMSITNEIDQSMCLIGIAKYILNQIKSDQEPQQNKPKRVVIKDFSDPDKDGEYVVLFDNDEVMAVSSCGSELPYRAQYPKKGIGKTWAYEFVESGVNADAPVKRGNNIPWDLLRKMIGKTILMLQIDADKITPVTITGFERVNNEEKIVVIREDNNKEKMYGILSKGKSWDAYEIVQ